MRYREQEDQNDWARDVPENRFQGPYSDYGWERGQSVLPEFRDPDFHFTPGERQRLARWQRSQAGYDSEWGNMPGPHTGKGPRGYVRSDERIYEEVCERMARHGDLDASNIDVEVMNGDVILKGEVQDRRAKRLAEDISDSVGGVQDVQNQLQIRERSGTPARWTDRVGGSGVYPASEAGNAPRDSQAQGMASWGQGDRGARGYEDHGESEIHPEDAKQSKR
ncbi:MAG: BON domain-containing protein [Bacteroidota bacterium]